MAAAAAIGDPCTSNHEPVLVVVPIQVSGSVLRVGRALSPAEPPYTGRVNLS